MISIPYVSGLDTACAQGSAVIQWPLLHRATTGLPMTGADVREVFETIIPNEALDGLISQSGFQERERKLDARLFLRSAVISAAHQGGGRQADILRHYFEEGAEDVARSAAYSWFDEAFEEIMEGLRDRALSYALSQPRDLPGILGKHVSDWIIVDSTTVRLDDSLKEVYPGTGKYAALKVHKQFSVGVGTTVGYHLSPAKEHDSKHLHIDESWKGKGLLVDLGYASLARLQACEDHNVRYVLRLKDNWRPSVQRIESGDLSKEFFRSTDFDELLHKKVILLNGKDIDADVRVGQGSKALDSRMVGVEGPKGYCWYLTNLPRDVSPAAVWNLYAVRWEIEQDNKLDKSCHRLDEIGAQKPCTVRALVHASIVASMIICLLAHKHRLEEGHAPRNRPYRTKPPIHPQLLAKMVGHAAWTISRAFENTRAEADAEWARLAKLFYHQGKDPNWRCRPSVLDQLRGWKIRPGKPRSAKRCEASGGLK